MVIPAMDFKDYYKILGVEPTADDKTIKAAYRKLARKYHPDVSKEKDAEAKFKDASEAYEALKSADKRAEYDDLRKYGQHGQPFQGPPGWQGRGAGGAGGFGGGQDSGDFSDFFSSIFGNRGPGFGGGQSRSAGRRGQDVEMELAIFLEETLSNESKKVSFQVPQYNAAGQHVSNTSKSLNVKIPAGVTDGERIRLKGQGAPGIGGGANGDLYLIIKFAPHPRFEVDGENLIINLPLAPWELALGAEVAVPTLTGKINLKVPAGSQNGQRMRAKGHGLLNKAGQRGYLFVQLNAVMPKTSDDEVKALWQELAKKAAFDQNIAKTTINQRRAIPSSPVCHSGKKPNQTLHPQPCKDPGQYVIEHDPDAAMHVAVDPANRPPFEDVEEAEQQEPCQQPVPTLRHQPQGDPHPDHLVPDDAFVIMYSQIVGHFAAQPEAEQHGDAEHQPVTPVGQHLPQRNKG